MKSKTSPLDILPTDILKNCVDVFAVVISRLANLSFEQGIFPTAFKTAQITPLLKKPSLDPELPSSYRPISNLNTISKVLEKLFLARVKPFIMASPNFCRMQSAYRKGHSTETALLYIYNDIFKSMDNRRGTVLVSLDLSAAFDMVDHDKLIQRLSDCFRLTGVAVTWVQSYLSNREQFIKIRDHSLRATRMESGVPQGSVLGPFLFSTYVSPLSKIIPDTVKFHQYADDTQLYCSISTSEFASEVTRLQDCVRDVSDWFLTNSSNLATISKVYSLYNYPPTFGVLVQYLAKIFDHSYIDLYLLHAVFVPRKICTFILCCLATHSIILCRRSAPPYV